MNSVLDRYFELSDVAGHDDKAFEELINLFSENAVLHPAGGEEIIGRDGISQFFDGFLKRNTVLKHVWVTRETSEGLETHWAVAGIRDSGEMISFKGVDTAELDEDGKIRCLQVRFH